MFIWGCLMVKYKAIEPKKNIFGYFSFYLWSLEFSFSCSRCVSHHNYYFKFLIFSLAIMLSNAQVTAEKRPGLVKSFICLQKALVDLSLYQIVRKPFNNQILKPLQAFQAIKVFSYYCSCCNFELFSCCYTTVVIKYIAK